MTHYYLRRSLSETEKEVSRNEFMSWLNTHTVKSGRIGLTVTYTDFAGNEYARTVERFNK